MASMSHHCSIFCKSLIFRNHLEQLLLQRAPRNVSFLLHRRLTHLPLLLLSDNIPFPSYSLPIRHSILLPSTPISPLLPPRTPPRSSPMSSLTTPPPPPPDSNPNPNPVTKTDRVVIKGRVQGVFYRDWTVQNATELGLKGWVRNRRDGSVEALFSGPPEKVQEMEQRCRRGPPAAAVTGFQAFPGNHDDPGTGFERRPTV